MPLDKNLDEGVIDKDETKRIVVIPKDAAGDAFDPNTLTADFTAESTGTTTSKTKSDFNSVGDEYRLDFTFDESGLWTVKISATDGSSNTETVKFKQLVEE